MSSRPARVQDLLVVLTILTTAVVAVCLVADARDHDVLPAVLYAGAAVVLGGTLRALWTRPRAVGVQLLGLGTGLVVALGAGRPWVAVWCGLLVWVVAVDRLELLRRSRNGLSPPS